MTLDEKLGELAAKAASESEHMVAFPDSRMGPGGYSVILAALRAACALQKAADADVCRERACAKREAVANLKAIAPDSMAAAVMEVVADDLDAIAAAIEGAKGDG